LGLPPVLYRGALRRGDEIAELLQWLIMSLTMIAYTHDMQ